MVVVVAEVAVAEGLQFRLQTMPGHQTEEEVGQTTISSLEMEMEVEVEVEAAVAEGRTGAGLAVCLLHHRLPPVPVEVAAVQVLVVMVACRLHHSLQATGGQEYVLMNPTTPPVFIERHHTSVPTIESVAAATFAIFADVNVRHFVFYM